MSDTRDGEVENPEDEWQDWECIGDRVSLDSIEVDKELGVRVHPFADAFPMMGGEELAELVADIRDNGLRVPIEYIGRHDELIIVDGRNRLKACFIAGVRPDFGRCHCVDSDEQLLSYIWSKNVRRRQLTASQRAIIATEQRSFIAKITEAKDAARRACLKRGGEKSAFSRHGNIAGTRGTVAEVIARMVDVSPRTMTDALAIAKSGDEQLIQAVKAGEKSASAAAKEVRAAAKVIEIADYAPAQADFLVQEPEPPTQWARQLLSQYPRDWCLELAAEIRKLAGQDD
jgi:ParB-like chromosome segregation protein Spo0J